MYCVVDYVVLDLFRVVLGIEGMSVELSGCWCGKFGSVLGMFFCRAGWSGWYGFLLLGRGIGLVQSVLLLGDVVFAFACRFVLLLVFRVFKLGGLFVDMGFC